ncbi:hypothetical protein M407DRAFT_11206 [Tulasnella calospora MUT 4182]|uniref:F-box domain-containing protein n=1 Tax=Tulasnella calospora MUT 4182 TaxID=1051891 RepID=A0A0C3LEI6_9AGAM|nr:hypothetical protein M407DRAFT_11206 [Tulasnella calospora MUT 4182]
MSALLHDVLNKQILEADNLATKLSNIKVDDTTTSTTDPNPLSPTSKRSSSPNSEDDELIAVQSAVVSPRSASRLVSRTPSRATSPTRVGAAGRRTPGRLLLSPTKSSRSSKEPSRDPLKILPSEISQKIFGLLTIHQLARCARVCRKWSKSQTLNYVWFQHYRKENFHDESLPAGKWTRRESKQNWRVTYLDLRKKDAQEGRDFFQRTGFSTPGGGGGGGGGGGDRLEGPSLLPDIT